MAVRTDGWRDKCEEGRERGRKGVRDGWIDGCMER